MCTQEAKHNRIIDLLDAHTNQKEIAKINGVIERMCSTSSMPKNLVEVQRDLLAMGGHHRKRTKIFLKTLKDKIMEDPTISMRRHAKTLNQDPKTIRIAVNLGLGLKSFFRQPQHKA